MTQANPTFLPAQVNGAGLSRLRWSAAEIDSLSMALTQLHKAGLQANRSKLDSQSILGGLRQIETDFGNAYEDAFWIEPAAGGYLARVSGPGNLSKEMRTSNPTEAATWVIETVRERGDLGSSTGS